MNGIRMMNRWITTNRHSTIVLCIAVLIASLFWIFPLRGKQETAFSYKLFKSRAGWGYDILVNDTLQIRQEFMPVIAKKLGFPEKEQAKKAAELVINKLKAGQQPAISRSELDQICPVIGLMYGSEREPE